jgi:hypothetical protein
MRTGPAASTQAIPRYTTSRDTIQLQNENHRQGLFDHLRNLVTLVALEIYEQLAHHALADEGRALRRSSP